MNTHRNRTLHRLRRSWENERQKILRQMLDNDSKLMEELGLNCFAIDFKDPRWSTYFKESNKRNLKLQLQLDVYYKCIFLVR